MKHSRKTVQDVFVRLCRDSGFRIDAIKASTLAGMMLGIHPLQVWLAMPCLDVMNDIAAGKHPAAYAQ